MSETKTSKKMPITARDPHHNGAIEWGWDGTDLWQRQFGSFVWTRVSRIHPTRHRVRMLAELMSFSVAELKEMQNGSLTPLSSGPAPERS